MSKSSSAGRTVAIFALALVLSLLLLTSFAYSQLTNSLQVSYIDVGQGDSIWLHGSDEHVEVRNDDTIPVQLSGWTLRDQASSSAICNNSIHVIRTHCAMSKRMGC